MSLHYERAKLLVEQSRYQMAEQELRQALAELPDDDEIHGFLAYCLSQLKRYEEAIALAKKAIALAPDNPYNHNILAQVLLADGQKEKAKNAIDEAIRLNCEEVGYFIVLSQILCHQKRYSEAIEAAKQGLELDPENVACLNNLACGLSGLGREDEAIAELHRALELNPNHVLARYNLGTFLLNQSGHPDESIKYMREALRLDPTYLPAQEGILSAIKAKNPLYRRLMPYRRWLWSLSRKRLLLFFVSVCLSFRLLLSLTETPLAPIIWPLVILYGILILFGIFSELLFDFLLRFDREGKLILSHLPKKSLDLVSVCLLLVLVSLSLYFLKSDNRIQKKTINKFHEFALRESKAASRTIALSDGGTRTATGISRVPQ
jgi:tetratricopeptide (TPR) repeat protein